MRWMTWRATSVRPCEGVLGEEECCALEARVAALAAEGGADAEAELPYALMACDVLQARMQAW